MSEDILKISVIVPFYHGNKYIDTLLKSVASVYSKVRYENKADIEVIVVNDSPDEEINITGTYEFLILKVKNERNIGIQGSRINGLKHSSGEWIIFLDQDDELVSDKFLTQFALLKQTDVIVNNGYLEKDNTHELIYKNRSEMKYLICKDIFLDIRNRIVSPGHCLVRKSAIPEFWKDNVIKNNGADDWLLWVLMFASNKRFAVNENVVYIHKNADGNNLSYDLKKMFDSCTEMIRYLKNCFYISKSDIKRLDRAIKFKYLKDSHLKPVSRNLRYADVFMKNLEYKITLMRKSYGE